MGTYLIYSAILLMLSGCTSKEFHLGWYDKCLPKTITEKEKVYPEITQEKLECIEIPKPPQDIKLQSQVATYAVDLMVAGKDCESNLKYVKISLDNFKNGDLE